MIGIEIAHASCIYLSLSAADSIKEGKERGYRNGM
jgi:hypothetical protein